MLFGAILVFVGYAMFAVGNLGLLQFAANTVSDFFAIGELLIGAGFLMALIGLGLRK